MKARERAGQNTVRGWHDLACDCSHAQSDPNPCPCLPAAQVAALAEETSKQQAQLAAAVAAVAAELAQAQATAAAASPPVAVAEELAELKEQLREQISGILDKIKERVKENVEQVRACVRGDRCAVRQRGRLDRLGAQGPCRAAGHEAKSG